MNLEKLFEIQRGLDAEIEKNHPVDSFSVDDRIYKKNLALVVELGECANEWRGFKFWSKNQKPNTDKCNKCNGTGVYTAVSNSISMTGGCDDCYGKGQHYKNPLLEEYVDCLHFILSIGNLLSYAQGEYKLGRFYKEEDLTKQFLMVLGFATQMQHDDYYYELMQSFLHLGDKLGFTWEQIETAYLEKNKINYERQNNGY